MSGSEDSTSAEDRSERTSERLPAGTWAEPSAQSGGRVSALLVNVDEQIRQLRHNVLQVLADDPSADVPLRTGRALEALAVSLQQANEHLVIASLDASARETKTAEAHRKQTLFLSMLAHELRNPLAPIVMSVELLRRLPGTSPAVQQLQAVLARQTAHLNRLVEDLLDATRINSGKIRIQKGRVLLSQLLAQAVETSQPPLDARHQTIVLHLPAQPVWMDGDLIRLSQLFSNLIINASKFSGDHTPITIRAWLDASQVLVSVQDEGIGIAPSLQPLVFDLFMQGPVGGGQMASGMGIGLSLVRTIAELHGGSVRVHSLGVGTGSEFIVALPLPGEHPQLLDLIDLPSGDAAR